MTAQVGGAHTLGSRLGTAERSVGFEHAPTVTCARRRTALAARTCGRRRALATPPHSSQNGHVAGERLRGHMNELVHERDRLGRGLGRGWGWAGCAGQASTGVVRATMARRSAGEDVKVPSVPAYSPPSREPQKASATSGGAKRTSSAPCRQAAI